MRSSMTRSRPRRRRSPGRRRRRRPRPARAPLALASSSRIGRPSTRVASIASLASSVALRRAIRSRNISRCCSASTSAASRSARHRRAGRRAGEAPPSPRAAAGAPRAARACAGASGPSRRRRRPCARRGRLRLRAFLPCRRAVLALLAGALLGLLGQPPSRRRRPWRPSSWRHFFLGSGGATFSARRGRRLPRLRPAAPLLKVVLVLLLPGSGSMSAASCSRSACPRVVRAVRVLEDRARLLERQRRHLHLALLLVRAAELLQVLREQRRVGALASFSIE